MKITGYAGAMLIAAVLLSGCVTTLDLSKFRDADLKEAQIMPDRAQLKQHRVKIVVFDAGEGPFENALNAHLGDAFVSDTEKIVVAAGAEVLDRNLANKLRDELRLSESDGAGSYKGPQVAHYVIRCKVISAEYGASYVEATNWTDKNGKTYHTPGYYSHAAVVSGSLSLYEMPSLRLVGTVDVQGRASASDPIHGGNQATGASLLRTAASNAISDKGYKLKNYFAPKGYVTERRTDGKNSIFEVMVGRRQGVKPEDKIIVYSLRKHTNALTGKEEMEELAVSDAKVSDKVGDEDAWIIPDNQETAAQIRLGDFVKVKYEENSIFSKLLGADK